MTTPDRKEPPDIQKQVTLRIDPEPGKHLFPSLCGRASKEEAVHAPGDHPDLSGGNSIPRHQVRDGGTRRGAHEVNSGQGIPDHGGGHGRGLRVEVDVTTPGHQDPGHSLAEGRGHSVLEHFHSEHEPGAEGKDTAREECRRGEGTSERRALAHVFLRPLAAPPLEETRRVPAMGEESASRRCDRSTGGRRGGEGVEHRRPVG